MLTQMSERMGQSITARSWRRRRGRWRAETTMTVGWIAECLALGTRGYLNHLLYRRRKLGGE